VTLTRCTESSIAAGRGSPRMHVTRRCDPCHTGWLPEKWLQDGSGRVMEVHDVLRGDGDAIAHGGVEMPALQHLQDLLLNPVADTLQQPGLDHIAAGIDGHFHDDVTLHSRWQIGPGNGRIRVDDGKSGNHFVCPEWRAGHAAEGRSATRRLLGSIVRRGGGAVFAPDFRCLGPGRLADGMARRQVQFRGRFRQLRSNGRKIRYGERARGVGHAEVNVRWGDEDGSGMMASVPATAIARTLRSHPLSRNYGRN